MMITSSVPLFRYISQRENSSILHLLSNVVVADDLRAHPAFLAFDVQGSVPNYCSMAVLQFH